MSEPLGTREVVLRLVGVYDADGGLRGELTYFVSSRLGRSHCSLCDVTHGLVLERQSWRDARGSLPVPFVTYHRDDVPETLKGAVDQATPCIFAETDRGTRMLVGAAEIARCEGAPDKLIEQIRAAVEHRALSW